MMSFQGNKQIYEDVLSGRIQGRTVQKQWTDRVHGKRMLGTVYEYKDERGDWKQYGNESDQKDVTNTYLKKELRRVAGAELTRLNRANEIILEAQRRRDGAARELEAGYGIEITKSINGKQVIAMVPDPEKDADAAQAYDFMTSGKVYVAGTDRTPSAAQWAPAVSASDVWITVYFDNATPTGVHTSSPGSSTDTYEVYRIKAGGINVQYGDIHESRT